MGKPGAYTSKLFMLFSILILSLVSFSIYVNEIYAGTSAEIVDQSNSMAPFGAVNIGSDFGFILGQQFVPTASTLSSVNIGFRDNTSTDDTTNVRITIWQSPSLDFTLGTLVGSVTKLVSEGPSFDDDLGTTVHEQTINFQFSPPLSLTPGLTYVIQVEEDDFPSSTDLSWTAGTSYSGGIAIKDGAAGPFSDLTFATFTIDTTPPTVVSVDTTKLDGSYTIGEVIDITVEYDEVVFVVAPETPTIDLNNGATATYSSGDGTDTLTFSYTVAGPVGTEDVADLDYDSTTALTLDEGDSIQDAAGNDADNTLPAVGTFATAHAIVIDTTPPTILEQPADNLVEANPQNAALTLVTYEPAFEVSDNIDTSPDINCEDDEENPLDNAVNEFAKGVTPVSCDVVDDAGNTTPADAFKVRVAEVVITEICVNETCTAVNPDDGAPDTTVEAYWGDVPDGSGDVSVKGTVWGFETKDLTVDWGEEDTAEDIILNSLLSGNEDDGATFQSVIHNYAQDASSTTQTVTVTFPGSTITSNLNAKVNVLPHLTTVFLDVIQDPYAGDVFTVTGELVDDNTGQGISEKTIEFDGDDAVTELADAVTSGFSVTDESGIIIDECSCGGDNVLRLNVGATIEFPSNPTNVIFSLHDMGEDLVDVDVDYTTNEENTFPATGQSQGINTGLFMISHPDGISSIEITGVSEEVTVGITRIQALNSENVQYIDEEFETLEDGESTSLSFADGSFFSVSTSQDDEASDLLVDAHFDGDPSYEASLSDPAPPPDPADPDGVFLESHEQTYSVLFATAGGFGGNAAITAGEGFSRTSILCAAGNDDDGDALCDDWEGPGNGISIAGTPDVYPLPGSNPNKKDIYVEIDYVSGQNPFVSGSNNDAIDDVIAAFAAAPVTNVGGESNGINLHVVQGDDLGPLPNLTVWTDNNPDLDDFNSIKAAYFGSAGETEAELSARAQAYHYFIFANSIGGSSGVAELLGNDGVVALGEGFDGTRAQIAGTFMHELGHNLNLNHGGPAIRTNADHGDNCKPNHDSVMTYSRQLPDLLGIDKWRLDYSDGDLRSNFPSSYGFGLRETTLYETFNLVSVSNPLRPSDPLPWIIWGTPGKAQPFLIQQSRASATAPNNTPTGINWNGDGVTAGTVPSDINNFGFYGCQASTPSSSKIFINYNEWTAIVYNFRQTPTGSFDGSDSLNNNYPVPPDDYDPAIANQLEILGAYHQEVTPWNSDSSYSTKGNVPIKVMIFDGEDIPIVGGDTTVSFNVFKEGNNAFVVATGPMEYDADKTPPHWHADWKPAKTDKGIFYIQVILPNPDAIPPAKITVDPDTDSDAAIDGNQPFMDDTVLMSMKVNLK